MILLISLILLVVYLLISIAVIYVATGHARKNKKSVWRWGWGAAFVMYSLVFWDWVPTMVVHQYYCAKDSGFWVYKTLDQWKAENPGVMEELVGQPSVQSTSYGDLQTLDERFAIETHRSQPIPFLLTKISERLLVDRKKGVTLAKGIEVRTDVGDVAATGKLKFWIIQKPCLARDFWNLTAEIQNMRGAK